MKKIVLFLLFVISALLPASAQLDNRAVNDSLRTQLVKMESDKVTYNVQADPDAQSLTLLDILRRVPMVTVDGQDNIQVNGTPMFKVYVNGKPNVMMTNNPTQAFRSMQASGVLTVEVITNPGARYDAEGVSGVLNVNTTQASASSQEGHSYSGSVHALMSNVNKETSAYISGQSGRFTYSANVLAYRMHAKKLYTRENYIFFTDDGDIELETGADDDNKKLYYQQAEVSLGYEPDDRSAINASFSYNNVRTRDQGETFTRFFPVDDVAAMYGYITNKDFDWSQKNINLNLNYQRYLNEERSRYFLFTYLLTSSPMKREESSEYDGDEGDLDLATRLTEAHQNQLDHTLQTDFSTALGKHHRITTGAKYINSRLSSKSDFYIDDDEKGFDLYDLLDYRYTNNILAGYIEYEGNYGKLGVKGGLRYEHTWQDVHYKKGEGEDFKKNYGQLVPSASMVYNISQTQSIGVNYNMRIVRPMIFQLDPYVDRSDPTSLAYGNTYLDVVKNHTINMVYNLFTPKLSLNLTLQHTFSDNAIEGYTFQDEGILHSTFGNIVKTRQTGLSLFANWTMTKTTQVTLSGNIAYNDMKSPEIDAHSHGWTGFGTLGIIQELPWQMKLSANLNPCTKTYTLQGWYAGHTLLSANITKGFFNDRLGVTIAAETALGHGGYYTSNSLDVAKTFRSTTYTRFPVQQVSIGLTYNFGNKTRPKVQPYPGSSFVNRVEMALWD